MKFIPLRLPACLALLTFFAVPCLAADPQPYDLAIKGDAEDFAQTIQDSSLLFSLRESAPAPPFALIDRAQRDKARIRTVVESYGYYAPHIDIAIAGREVDDPELPNQLDEVPDGQKVDVTITIARGPLYRLDDIRIDGDLPDGKRNALGLSSGQPAVAAEVLGGQERLLRALQEDGYAFATVDVPVAYADDSRHALDVSFKTSAGPRVTLGELKFKGLKDVNESFARDSLTIKSGQLFKPSEIETARQSLVKLGVFSGVSVQVADRAKPGDTVDLVFDVQERKMHTVALSGSYSTDLGASASVGWSHHNLFGNAEQLNLLAAVTGVAGNATDGLGYNLSAQLIKPHFLAPDQSLQTEIGAVKQNLDAYSQTAENFGIYLNRELWPHWKGTVGLTATYNQVNQQGIDYLYYLAALPFTATYDDVDQPNPLVDPASGFRTSLSLTPTLAFGSNELFFAILQASGSAYFDLSGDGGSVVAIRALAASIQGASNFDVPPDRRLYAGGSGTVRGFRYQSIGPSFADGTPTGATSVDAATIELRQRFGEDWGAAVFVDAGQASTTSVPFNGAVNVGAGAGIRYYTSIGAIRADIAVPLTQGHNQDSFQIYIGLGQAF